MLLYDSTIDVESDRFSDIVLDSVDEYVGDDLPQSDPRALIQARLDEDDPSLDNTVFADTYGKPAAALAAPAFFELRSTLTRRRLDDESVLFSDDLDDLRDFFLVNTTAGGYSRGVVRVFYPSPRNLFFDVTRLITVQGRDGGPARVYRPEFPQQFSVTRVRENVSGSLFFVDVNLVATETGNYYDLEEGEAQGASGFSGAVRVTNLSRFSGGVSADTIPTFLARIRNSVVLRSLSTPGGASFVIPGLGVTSFEVVQGGDVRMVRDRIYGPATIAGVPGGFRLISDDIPDGDYVRLGIAFDIYISPSVSQQLTSFVVSNVRDEGVEILTGDDGSLSYNGVTSEYTLSLNSSRAAEQIAPNPDNEGLLTEWAGRLRPIEEGDIFEFEGLFVSSVTGERRSLVVTAINTAGTILTLEDVDPALDNPIDPGDPLASGSIPGRYYRFLRQLTGFIEATETTFVQPVFCIPLTDPRALDSSGEEIFVGSSPALPRPGTERAEAVGGSFVPRTTNAIDDIASFPVVSVERLEILDPITQQSSGDYIYPRHPLFVEFLNSTAGSEQLKATRVRVHLLGPQATAVGRDEIANADETIRMVPLHWYFATVTTVGTSPTTDEIHVQVAGVDPPFDNPLTTRPLFHEYSGAIGTTLVSSRVPRAGDWVHFISTGGNEYFFPISAVDIGGDAPYDDGIVTISAPDIPSGLDGEMYIYQGGSRATMLSDGRGPEGTYSIDIWCREVEAAGDYSPGDPPIENTRGFLARGALLSQGFEIVSPLPGQQFSVAERVSLTIQGTHVVDSQEILGRSIQVHSFPGDRVAAIQDQLDSGLIRPMVTSGLAKTFPPAFVVVSFYYDSETLEPEDAAEAVFEAFENADTENRIERSDLVSALYDAGADYVEGGRVFVLRQDQNRNWTYEASRGAIRVESIGDFVLQAVTVTRLLRRGPGEVLDATDPDNWADDPFTLRPGGFDED